jgi:hypothetical protein
MKEFFESYAHLKEYPEFDADKIMEKYRVWVEDDSETGEGHWAEPEWMFDPKLAFEYVMLAYAPDSSLAKMKDLQVRKEKAMEQGNIPKEYAPAILRNENPMIGDMITRLFRELNDFEYELIISGKEAIQTLLEVVRKPVNSRLLDDKERNAVKAKRECFDDAEAMMGRIKSLVNQMSDINEDLGDHAKKSVFQGGLAERLAEKAKKS